jgi:hypothetical protein
MSQEFNLINVKTPEPTSVDKTFGNVETLDDYLTEHFGGPRSETNAQQWDRKKDELEREDRMRLSKMSPRGSLGLPDFLDKRRLEWLVTDGAFAISPLYNRVYIHQIPMPFNKKKGLIHTPDTVAHKELRSCHRGVLVGAGGLALDALRSNGVDLGHVVHFIHVNPWRLFVDYAEGHFFQVLVMTVDCVAGSEDLAEAMKTGKAKIQVVDGKHQLTDPDGHMWDPVMPQGVEVW